MLNFLYFCVSGSRTRVFLMGWLIGSAICANAEMIIALIKAWR